MIITYLIYLWYNKPIIICKRVLSLRQDPFLLSTEINLFPFICPVLFTYFCYDCYRWKNLNQHELINI